MKAYGGTDIELNTVLTLATKAEHWLLSLYGRFTAKKETQVPIGYEDGNGSGLVQKL